MFSQTLRRTYRNGLKLKKQSFRFLSGGIANAITKNDALAGIRILDLSRILAGPFCTMLLGDLGAEIIKVENPDRGDETRRFGPPFINEESVYFMSLNRNKKSIAIDLKLPEGRNLIKELAMKCDVLVENFVPGKMTEFGLDYENLKSLSPRLIYCTVSGYGSTGPYKSRPCVDIVAASIGGLMHITGPKDGEPCSVGVPITDVTTGLYAHGAIMAALIQRATTGLGQNIQCDLLSSQVAVLTYAAANYLNCGIDFDRQGSLSDFLVPYEAFKTKDGYISISSVSDKACQEFSKRLNIPDITKDPKFRTNQDRLKNRTELSNIFANIFKTNTTEHWLKTLEGGHLIYGAVNNLKGVFNDPQVIHKNMVNEMEHKACGKVKLVGPAVSYSSAHNKARLPPPCLGEHTDVVLSDVLSYSSDKIQNLRKSKIVF